MATTRPGSSRDTAATGLEGVVAAETVMSQVDGERGRLLIRGHDVEDLAESLPFEGVCALLWEGAAPGSGRDAELRADLGRGREAAFARLGGLGTALEAADGMTALRSSLAQLPADLGPRPTER